MLDTEFKSLKIQSSIVNVFYDYKYVVLHHFDALVFDNDKSISAKGVLYELIDIIAFNNMYYQKTVRTVKDYLKNAGYSTGIILRFERQLGFRLDKSIVKNRMEIDGESSLSACFKRIFTLYEKDLYNYIDNVINDSEEDPQFSAATLIDRLDDAIIINKALYEKDFSGINSYLQFLGYPLNTISILERKKDEEKKYRIEAE